MVLFVYDGDLKGNLMKIYLASRYSRREELLGYAQLLKEDGHVITSRWLREDSEEKGAGIQDPPASFPVEAQVFANLDYSDVKRSDALLLFSEYANVSLASRGGRHVEFGLALAWGKRLFVCGPRENVFHTIKGIGYTSSFEEMRDLLSSDYYGYPVVKHIPCHEEVI